MIWYPAPLYSLRGSRCDRFHQEVISLSYCYGSSLKIILSAHHRGIPGTGFPGTPRSSDSNDPSGLAIHDGHDE